MARDVVETLKAVYQSLGADEHAAEDFDADPAKFLHDHNIDLSAYSPEDIVDASHLALEGADPAVAARVAAAPRLAMRLPAESDHEANLRHIGHFANVASPDYEPPQADHATGRDRFIDTHLRQDILTTSAMHVHGSVGDVVVGQQHGSPDTATGGRFGGETEFGAGAGFEPPPVPTAMPISDAGLAHPGAALDGAQPLLHMAVTAPEVPIQVPEVDHDPHLAPLLEQAEDAPEDPDDTPPTGAAHIGGF
jgi:hypothetical protein